MDIIVPIKQVPETSRVKMDAATGTMIRTGVETVVNPLDLYAIEAALRLREQYGGKVTAISMGPKQALKALKEALAMGCDNAVLVCDHQFAGSDTWATSYTLSCAVRILGHFDLIITGERATDGDTGQVGPGLAAWLDIPAVTYAASICLSSDGDIVAERMVEEGYQRVQVTLPALISVVKEIGSVRLPTLKGKKKALQAEIPVISADKLSSFEPLWGLSHSPTKVVSIEKAIVVRQGRQVVVGKHFSEEEAVDQLIAFLEERNLI